MDTSRLLASTPLALRPVRDDDAAFLAALYRSTRSDLRMIEGHEEMVEGLIALQQRTQAAAYGAMYPNAMYFLVERQGDRIGRMVVDFNPDEVHVVDISLIPEARGQGHGAQLLRMAQHAAAEAGTCLSLAVRPENPRARQLYLSLGFASQGLDPMHMTERMVWCPAELAGHLAQQKS
jgi:ribosomal protein S18 acetylase RimI-like enzyme